MTEVKTKTFPVVELFGPTIQGEGVDQGVPCHFVRFGGCDYACTWCDTPYAVIASEVRDGAAKMSAQQIADDLEARSPATWIILTGGNPALLDLSELVEELQTRGFLVAVETQGSKWKSWMAQVDRLCVSPKPPSSLELKAGLERGQLETFLASAFYARDELNKPFEWLFLKIVVFDDKDLNYVEEVRRRIFPDVEGHLFVSSGNDAGRTVGNPTREDPRGRDQVRQDLLNQATWVTDELLKRPELCGPNTAVQSQYHTLLWGNGQGF